MADSVEELEPLFDYSRVQPDIICLDDEDASPAFPPKRRKTSESSVEVEENDGKVIHVIDSVKEVENEWLPPPPKFVSKPRNLAEDATLKQLRLKKQELLEYARSAEEVLRAAEEYAKQRHVEEQLAKPSTPVPERAKIVISIQDKDGPKQFRVYEDDKFERLFKLYADRVKIDLKSLVFCFDGDKISPTATPHSLGMEDDDIIEVHVRPR